MNWHHTTLELDVARPASSEGAGLGSAWGCMAGQWGALKKYRCAKCMETVGFGV